jgi:hypothetical protein
VLVGVAAASMLAYNGEWSLAGNLSRDLYRNYISAHSTARSIT